MTKPTVHEMQLLKEARDLWGDPADTAHVAVFYRMLKARDVFTDDDLDATPDAVPPLPTVIELALARAEIEALKAKLAGRGK